jgi:prefoldin subunit 5
MLRKKADMMSGGIQVEYLADEDLASLRKKESQLIGESKQVARMVARLSSRAEKLMSRADALEKWQKNGNSGQMDVGVNGVNGQ